MAPFYNSTSFEFLPSLFFLIVMLTPLVIAGWSWYQIDHEGKSISWPRLNLLVEKPLKGAGVYVLLCLAFLAFRIFAMDIDKWSMSNASNPDPVITPSSLLPSLVGAMLTIYVAFISFILVAIQLASAQFSPRLIRHIFPKDPVILWLAIFLLITISFLALSLIGVDSENYRISDSYVMALSLFCIPVFFSFVLLLVQRLNVTNIAKAVMERTKSEISTIYGKKEEGGTPQSSPSEAQRGDYDREFEKSKGKIHPEIVSEASGFIQEIDFPKLEELKARMEKNRVFFTLAVGQYVHIGDTLIESEHQLSNEDQWRKTIVIGNARSYEQDIQLGIRQLVDIAVKAVSPAVNDPTTCITCLYNLTDIILELQSKPIHSINYQTFADSGIFIKEFHFDHIIDNCFDQIYQWSKKDVDVTRNIVRSLRIILKKSRDLFEWKVICDEFIDLGLYEGTLKPLWEVFSNPEFHSQARQVNELLTKEACILLSNESRDLLAEAESKWVSLAAASRDPQNDVPPSNCYMNYDDTRKLLNDAYEYLEQKLTSTRSSTFPSSNPSK